MASVVAVAVALLLFAACYTESLSLDDERDTGSDDDPNAENGGLNGCYGA